MLVLKVAWQGCSLHLCHTPQAATSLNVQEMQTLALLFTKCSAEELDAPGLLCALQGTCPSRQAPTACSPLPQIPGIWLPVAV